jgi:hypothetical protein
MVAIWPLVVAIVGILLYALSNAKTSEIGKWVFIIGFYWTVATMIGKTVKLF